jgi:hypothetical protein
MNESQRNTITPVGLSINNDEPSSLLHFFVVPGSKEALRTGEGGEPVISVRGGGVNRCR